MEDLTCFVIIGFGKKTSYANGKMRVLDLDETYTLLIKPVFDALNISCYRAIDKNLSGSIDKLMLQEIKNADIALVDISTLNANVMWELGVRHALRPNHTIMICEQEQMGSIPFDVGHFVIHQYTHSDQGIPYKEVERFRAHLTNIIKGVLNQEPKLNDSPVFTFLENELKALEMNITEDASQNEQNPESFASLLDKAEYAKKTKDFSKALKLFGEAKTYAEKNMTLKDNLTFIVSRQALCTYKSKQPNELEALVNAKIILEELQPLQSNDLEVLGLTGAINKRLYELTSDLNYLENAIASYEKGFQLKQDYYNGINAAFMLYKKTDLLKSQHKLWEDLKLKADYIRNTVLEITLNLEKEPDFSTKEDAIWILLTIAEAYHYKGLDDLMATYENKGQDMAKAKNDTFAMNAYSEQKEKIKDLNINFK
ncbi:TRAFs-binding domain-containing protein [Hwangdonia sp.]|uniref:TRAFs-binding domain-containing protein n=1 Tax=Hwangdonia sp. TaxID=1883432 RepID=UPI003AB7670F